MKTIKLIFAFSLSLLYITTLKAQRSTEVHHSDSCNYFSGGWEKLSCEITVYKDGSRISMVNVKEKGKDDMLCGVTSLKASHYFWNCAQYSCISDGKTFYLGFCADVVDGRPRQTFVIWLDDFTDELTTVKYVLKD